MELIDKGTYYLYSSELQKNYKKQSMKEFNQLRFKQ